MPERLDRCRRPPAASTWSAQLLGFPRHLSQHTGGMVMTRGPLCELVPIENAAMPGRTVIQWNKDDLDELGILKVDCLALGMLTAIRKCFDLVRAALRPAAHAGQHPRRRRGRLRHDLPGRHDGRVPDRKPGADEHAAAAAAAVFYDLVIEVAIVRPGPIQGEHGPSLSPPPQRRGAGDVSQRGDPPGAGKDAGRAAVSGAGDAAGGGGGRLHARRGRPAPPRHGRLAAAGPDRPVPPAS